MEDGVGRKVQLDVLHIPKQSHKSDHVINYLQKPQSLILIFLILATLFYKGLYRTESDTILNTKAGLVAALVVFLIFSMIQMRDGLFVRPHPAFWRIVMGAAVAYLVFLVFLLFQSPQDVRHIWTYWDPELGKPLVYRDYAVDCRIYTPENPESKFINVKNTLFDEFVLAHIIGWFIKSFLFRDINIAWTWSILFELIERSLSHILPNFRECWWDQIFLDVLICNAFGIYLGHLVMYLLQMKTYNWVGVTENVRSSGLLRVFIPYKWDNFDWKVFDSLRRFLSVLYLLFLCAIIEFNCFFLKYVLWHPPTHMLVFWRLIFMWLISLPALREYYQWVSNPKIGKIGTMAWLSMLILAVELLLWVKLSKEMFEEALPTPPLVIYCWSIFSVALIFWTIIYFKFWKPWREGHVKKE